MFLRTMPPAELSQALVARLHARAGAVRWRVPVERFGAVLEASVAHAFSDRVPSARQVEQYLEALHLDDLALATACADGDEQAWEHFVREVRPILYRSADAIDSTGGARELADSLYGDLFGVREQDGRRQSLFRYFHGRSRLTTWIRAVLSQRHIDRVRATRRIDALPEDDSPLALPSPALPPDPERLKWVALIRLVLAAVIATLAPRDRLRLGCYYGQNLKLAAIGRLLGEHEATVSRHLTRTKREIRDGVETRLRRDHGLDEAAVAECFAAVVEDAGGIDLAEVLGPDGDRKNDRDDRSTVERGRSVETR
jgi:RNA polymerase sigma factor (sigma-70 family)